MMRQLDAPQPQAAPEVSLKSEKIVIEVAAPCTFTQSPTSVGIAAATVGFAEISAAKKSIPETEEPPAQKTVILGLVLSRPAASCT